MERDCSEGGILTQQYLIQCDEFKVETNTKLGSPIKKCIETKEKVMTVPFKANRLALVNAGREE